MRLINSAKKPHDHQRRLLLGWPQGEPKTFGFGPATNPTPADLPMFYDHDAHLITVAPTRSGKGRGVIVPNLLHYTGPVVVLDPKGENYQVTARRRREMGHTVVRLDPFHVLDESTDGINPFDVFTLPRADVVTDAQMLAHLLATGNQNGREPFWDLNGCGLLTGLIAYVATVKEAALRNLNEVCKALSSDDVVYNLAVVLDTVGKQLPKHAYQEIASFLQMPDLTRGGVLATAESYIKPFLSDRVEVALAKSSVPLIDVVEGKPLSIYIVIPPDKLQSHKALLKLWIGTLLKAITTRNEAPAQRTLFLLDECGQLGNFPFLETMITLSAGYGVWCWSFWQDLSQLKAAYPTSWENILNNCGVVQTFGIHNRAMATQWGQYLHHDADALHALTPEEQVVSIHGQPERRSRRLDYLNDGLFSGLFDENRFHRRAKHQKDETPGSQC
jgi:type IV secretion system protein VirD4